MKIKNIELKLFNILLATTLNLVSCGKSNINPVISKIGYKSNSSENSLNRTFVTDEDIKISVNAREDVNKVELETIQDSNITNSYEMAKQDDSYSIALKFSDATIFQFRVKAHFNDSYSVSDSYTIPIYLSEQDTRNFIKNWLDDSRRNNQYVQNAYTIDYIVDIGSRQIIADFNLEKVENKVLTNDALIEYVGENDGVQFAREDETYFDNQNIRNLYLYPSRLYDYLQQKETTTTLTRKQDIESSLTNFYYALVP